MTVEAMAKIFEPLYTTNSKGIGLGLAVSRHLVEVNGGHLEVQSIEGQDSTPLPSPSQPNHKSNNYRLTAKN
jgi:signal transduction histidine kinase